MKQYTDHRGTAKRLSRLAPRRVFIDTRTWWDRTYGNTYSATQARVESSQGKVVARVWLPFQYGNDARYQVTQQLGRVGVDVDRYNPRVQWHETTTDGLQRDAKWWGVES
jgi:hypothetical protein